MTPPAAQIVAQLSFARAYSPNFLYYNKVSVITRTSLCAAL
jgi:hypothetical protein